MATGFASEAEHIQEIADLTPALIGRGTGANETTVRTWLRGTSEPSGIRAERLGELSYICDQLVRVMRRDYAKVWLTKPIEALDGNKPLDLIADGHYQDVSQLLGGLESYHAI